MDVMKRLNRREFLRASGVGVAGILAAACVPVQPPAPAATEPAATELAATEPPAAKAPVTVTFLEYYSTNWETWGPDADRWAAEFNDMHPEADIVVERRTFVGDANWEDTLVAAASSGNFEDVAPAQVWHVPVFVDMVPLATTDEYRQKVGGDSAFSFGAKWKGHEYLLPHYGGPLIPWSNEDILGAGGVEFPKTWEEVIPVGQKVTDPAKSIYATSIMLGAGGGNHLGWAEFFPTLAQAGGEMMDDQGKLVINNEAAVQVLEFWKAMEDGGVLIPGSLTNVGNFSLQAMGSGQLAWQAHEGPWMFPHLASSGVTYKFKGNLVPEGPGGRQALGYCGAFCVNANAKHPEYAAEWALYLTTGEAAYEWGKSLKMTFGYIPVSERIVAEVPDLQPEIDQAKLGVTNFPVIPAWNELNQILSKRIGEFWVGEKKPMDALNDIVKDWEAAVERA